jgi:hypothetical protein
MVDELARRFVTRQLQLTAKELEREAERLAVATRIYADEIAAGRHGSAHRLAQDAAALALTERRLAGMREIAGLIAHEPDASAAVAQSAITEWAVHTAAETTDQQEPQ